MVVKLQSNYNHPEHNSVLRVLKIFQLAIANWKTMCYNVEVSICELILEVFIDI